MLHGIICLKLNLMPHGLLCMPVPIMKADIVLSVMGMIIPRQPANITSTGDGLDIAMDIMILMHLFREPAVPVQGMVAIMTTRILLLVLSPTNPILQSLGRFKA